MLADVAACTKRQIIGRAVTPTTPQSRGSPSLGGVEKGPKTAASVRDVI